MKIIGFSQLRNERSKGNLENWLKCMDICDYIYIVDQASDDNSKELYDKCDKISAFYNKTNDFENEIFIKSELLKRLRSDHPDTDWIFWVDGDTLIDGRLLSAGKETLKHMCGIASANNADGITFGHYNLWRSDIYYRIDDGYHGLNDSGVICLWRNTPEIFFPENSPGLHGSQYPRNIKNIMPANLNLIHRGFATDEQIMLKYDIYKTRGQTGWELDRLLNESSLAVEELPKELLPNWFDIKDSIDPTKKKKIIEIYNDKLINS
tara:strand:+ start:13684 stop:14478 length:795 start_codon:yes stop_codon:yes gene_type:complete